MKNLNQRGAINALLLSLIVVSVLFAGSLGVGYWAFMSRQDYKNNSDKKSAAASQKAVEATQAADAAKYAEEAKKPYTKYTGPAAFGSVSVMYPKTWSAYVIEDIASGGFPLDGYFQPGFVPSTADPSKSFALRVRVDQTAYSSVLNDFADAAQSGKVRVTPYSLPKVPGVVGSRIEGQITPTKQGVMVVLPLRNTTLKIWSESQDYTADLDNIVLPNLSFSP